jgi:hypothetical protein
MRLLQTPHLINVSKRFLYPISTIEGRGLKIRGRERTEKPAEDAGCVKSVQEAPLGGGCVEVK